MSSYSLKYDHWSKKHQQKKKKKKKMIIFWKLDQLANNLNVSEKKWGTGFKYGMVVF